MSLTKNGLRIGMARHIEIQEEMEHIRDANKQILLEQERGLMRACIDIEGEEKFFEWYDDDDIIPEYGPISKRIEAIEKRLEDLKAVPMDWPFSEAEVTESNTHLQDDRPL